MLPLRHTANLLQPSQRSRATRKMLPHPYLRHVKEHFRYEGVARAEELHCHGDWLFTLYLMMGYHHAHIQASC